MQVLYSFKTFAITVRHWFEVTEADEEHGCRVELRMLSPQPHRGSESASQMVVLDQPVWRTDIFDVVGGASGNLARAHYHPTFHGVEPCERHYDDALARDPITWVTAQLNDVDSILLRADVDCRIHADEQSVVTDHLKEVALSIHSRLAARCLTPMECLRATGDVAHLVPRMFMDLRSTARALDPREGCSDWSSVMASRTQMR